MQPLWPLQPKGTAITATGLATSRGIACRNKKPEQQQPRGHGGCPMNTTSSRINAAMQAFAVLLMEEKDTIAENIGKEETEDFPSA
jgi:hypothetical protein